MATMNGSNVPNDSSNFNSTPANPVDREKLIRTAVNFLRDDTVRASSLKKKTTFLKKKGLTEEEIQIALQQAGPAAVDEMQYQRHELLPLPPPPQVVMVQQPSYWSSWHNVAKTVVLVSGLSYGVYYLFDRYFGNLLWGNRDRLRSLEESIESLDRSLISTCRDLQESLVQVKESLAQQQIELSRLADSRSELVNASNHIAKLETEIATVKGLLLSRRQFPTVPSSAPGIPAWQLHQEVADNTTTIKDSSSGESGGDPSPVSNGTSSPELVERVIDDRVSSD